MEILQQKKFDQLTWYFGDEHAFYMLYPRESYFELLVIDGNTFTRISSSKISYHPNSIVRPFIDGDVIYMPSVDGRIIGIDKYSQDIVTDFDLGPVMALRKPVYDDNRMYTVCAIPISNRPKTDTDINVICINDRSTGKKIGQSCVLHGKTSPTAITDRIWVSHSKNISRFSLDGEQERSAKLSFDQSYPPEVTDKYVFTFSAFGGIEIFDFNLKPAGRLMTGRNECAPFRLEETVYWLLKGHLAKISLDTEQVERVAHYKEQPKGEPVFHGGRIYAATKEGGLLEVDVSKGVVNHLSLGENLQQPVLVENNIYIASDSELFQICLNSR